MVGVVISPALKKPKKQSTAAAHIMITSGSDFLGVQCFLSIVNIAGVIGNLIFVAFLDV